MHAGGRAFQSLGLVHALTINAASGSFGQTPKPGSDGAHTRGADKGQSSVQRHKELRVLTCSWTGSGAAGWLWAGRGRKKRGDTGAPAKWLEVFSCERRACVWEGVVRWVAG